MRNTWKLPSTKINFSSWKACIFCVIRYMPYSSFIFLDNWNINQFSILLMRIWFYIWYTSTFLLFDFTTNFFKFLLDCLFFGSFHSNIIFLNNIIFIFLSPQYTQNLLIIWRIDRYSRSYMRNDSTIRYSKWKIERGKYCTKNQKTTRHRTKRSNNFLRKINASSRIPKKNSQKSNHRKEINQYTNKTLNIPTKFTNDEEECYRQKYAQHNWKSMFTQ